MKEFFYIIQRSGQIHEIEYTQERLNSAFEQWQKGGLIIFPFLGTGINCVDITNIFTKEPYLNYIETSRPKTYILNGCWYDMSDRNKPFRYEKWKQDEIDKKLKLKEPEPILTEEQKEKNRKIREEISKIWGVNNC